MRIYGFYNGVIWIQSSHSCTVDIWRDPKVIIVPQQPVIMSHFGLQIARIAIADNIYLTILQKKGELAWPALPLITRKCKWAEIYVGGDTLKNL